MKYVSLIIIIFSTTLSSQTILNSEKVLSKIDSVLVVGIGLDGDFSKGNINLVQTNFSAQFGKKINKNVGFKNIKPIKVAVAMIMGKDISVILFSLINFALALLRKNGHVAPKWVSANNKIVKKIR